MADGIQFYQTTNPSAPRYYSGGPSRITGADYKTAEDARKLKQGDYDQDLLNFSSFVNKFFPMAGGGSTTISSTSGGAGTGAAGGPITQVPGMGTVGTWTPSALPPMPTLPNPQSTSDLAFGKAKDQVGSSLQGLMKALGNQFADRGISGSSTAGNTIADTLVKGNGQLAQVATDQAIHDANTANDFAKTQFEGSLTGRGQDIGALESARSAALGERGQDVTMRGQDITDQSERARLAYQQQQDRLGSIMGLWKAFMGSNGKSLY